MAVHKQSISFTDVASDFAKERVERGEYPNVSAAVSGELARAKARRAREQAVLEAEVQRRLALPLDRWEPVDNGVSVTADSRAHLAARMQAQGGKPS